MDFTCGTSHKAPLCRSRARLVSVQPIKSIWVGSSYLNKWPRHPQSGHSYVLLKACVRTSEWKPLHQCTAHRPTKSHHSPHRKSHLFSAQELSHSLTHDTAPQRCSCSSNRHTPCPRYLHGRLPLFQNNVTAHSVWFCHTLVARKKTNIITASRATVLWI